MNQNIKTIVVMATFLFVLIMSKITEVSAWGDNSGIQGGRPGYTMQQIDDGILGDKIVFNSITNNPNLGEGANGDERKFVGAREYKDTDPTHDFRTDELQVEDGKEYELYMYAHNDNPRGIQAIAKDVRAFFNIPNVCAKNQRITGFLDSSNATPTEVLDDVYLKSDTNFYLVPVSGSATIYSKGKTNGMTLSDDIWGGATGSTEGVLLGYDSLNGEIPGGFLYVQILTIRVKVIYDYDYSVNTTVRLVGDTDKTWKKEVDAKIGDKVEFQIEYKNTSSIWQNDVVIRDILPSNLRYVPGSTRIANSAHPNGAVVQEDDLVEDGIFVGNYDPDANVFVRFTTEVVNDTFTYGKFILHNWGHASVAGRLVQDSAAVIVEVNKNNNIENYKTFSIIFTFITILLSIVVILMLLKFWHYTKNLSH